MDVQAPGNLSSLTTQPVLKGFNSNLPSKAWPRDEDEEEEDEACVWKNRFTITHQTICLVGDFLPSLLVEPVLETTPGLPLNPSEETDTC